MIGAIMILIPGLMMSTSIRDIFIDGENIPAKKAAIIMSEAKKRRNRFS